MAERTLELELSQEEYDRLTAVTDDPEALVRDALFQRVGVEESVAFTRDGGFRSEAGLSVADREDAPRPPIGALVGFDIESVGDGESHLSFQAGPEHANPMGTLHGGVLCDVGDAAMGTAYASTLGPEESFTTLELKVNYLRPVWDDRLTATGRVVSGGRTVGLVECEIHDEEERLVAKLSSTCLTLRGEQASGR
ncbi:PaaI family thioesterase [Halomarina oriensis]|uniref:Hotdog fold thioesterase n=1 Tax=Halomarina oriensis TaxID=671145 RepID=A0A6B0GL25_9EURY|nr:PaaI family thioesterase [Halomarina oriensis]MWG35330.1 hotdog fold thioesterase [Halomarina oriensis]